MRIGAQGVQDEDVEVGQQGDTLRGKVAEIGEVGGGAEAVAGDGLAAMGDGDAEELRAEEIDLGAREGRGDAVQVDACGSGVAVTGGEGVAEDALEGLGSGVVGVEGKVDVRVKAQGTEVVHAEDVVGVAMGVEDGVEAAKTLAHGLSVEVGAGVDDNVMAPPRNEDRGTSAAVMRRRHGLTGRGRDRGDTDRTVTAQRGDAHRGSGSEES